jgi:hypothetical protein
MLLRRGADRGIAFAAYLVVVFLGVSAFLSSIAFGGLIVLALLLLVAARLDADAAPSPLVKALVTLAFLVMATSSSLGVAGLGACLLTVLLTGRLRRWWWTFLPGLAAYAAWYATRGGSDPQGSVGWGHLPSIPGDTLRLVGNAAGRLFGLEGGGVIAGAVVAAALAAGFGWLAWKRRLRRWDLIFGGVLAAYLLMVTLVRGAAGKIPLEIARYSWPIILLAVPLVVPHLRFPGRWPAAARTAVLLVAGGALVLVNAWQRVADTNAIEREAFGGRVAIETVGRLLSAGEPAITELHLKSELGIGMGGVLTVADLHGFLADGWVPAPSGQWAEREAARVSMRLFPAGRWAGEEEEAPPALTFEGEAPDGCVEVRPGGARRFVVAAAGEFSLEAAGRDWSTTAGLGWRDAFGEFRLETVVSPRATMAAAAPPAGGAVLRITNLGDKRLSVCGVVGAG